MLDTIVIQLMVKDHDIDKKKLRLWDQMLIIP